MNWYAIKRRIKKILKRSKFRPISKTRWDEEYSNGSWSFLESPDELPRYSIIHGLISFFNAFDSILDVGCGDGVLYDKLKPLPFMRYEGIDISESAISQANRKKNSLTEFRVSTIEAFHTDKHFDCIVFNEVLTYLENPSSIISKYISFLKPSGILIISMHVNQKSLFIWDSLSKNFDFIDETMVKNKFGTTWICKVLRK